MNRLLSDSSAWMADSSEAVLARARGEIEARAFRATQAELLRRALDASNCARGPRRYHASIHLPLLIHAAVTGEDAPAVPLAAACTLLWAGAELYDNLTDGDLSGTWRESAPFDVVFTATAIACVLPPAIIADLPVPEERRLAMVGELHAGLLHMFDGQQRDLALTDSREPSAAEVEASVVGKNGAPKSFFAGLAAHMAGAPPEARQAYMRFALGMGVVYQLQSDLAEMYHHRRCRDLEQGTRTLHIALGLESVSGSEREALVDLLGHARTDPEAQQQVRDRLRRADVIRPWVAVVRRYAADAEASLDAAGPLDPAGSLLRDLLRVRSPRCG